jgi:prolipoprotein diacylglyceryltransferase
LLSTSAWVTLEGEPKPMKMTLQLTDLQAALFWNAALFLTLIVALLVQWLEFRRRKLDAGSSFLFAAMIAMTLILGARLAAVAPDAWLSFVRGNPLEFSGGKFHFGGILLLAPLYFLLRRLWKLPDQLADALFITLPLISSITHLGCAAAGCCHGLPGQGLLCWSYGPGMPAYEAQLAEGLIPAGAGASLPVYANQLFFFLANLLVFAVLWRRRKKMKPGSIALWAFAMVGFQYFWIGFFARPLPGLLGLAFAGMTLAQWGGLFLATFALITAGIRIPKPEGLYFRLPSGQIALSLLLFAALSLGLRRLFSPEESLILLAAALPVLWHTLRSVWKESCSLSHRLATSTVLSASVALLAMNPLDSLPPFQKGDQWLDLKAGGVFGSYKIVNITRDCNGNVIESKRDKFGLVSPGLNASYHYQIGEKTAIGGGLQGQYLKLNHKKVSEYDQSRSLFLVAPYVAVDHEWFALHAGPVLTSEPYTRNWDFEELVPVSAYLRLGTHRKYSFDVNIFTNPATGLLYDEPRFSMGFFNWGFDDPSGRTNLRLALNDFMYGPGADLTFRLPIENSNFTISGGLHTYVNEFDDEGILFSLGLQYLQPLGKK